MGGKRPLLGFVCTCGSLVESLGLLAGAGFAPAVSPAPVTVPQSRLFWPLKVVQSAALSHTCGCVPCWLFASAGAAPGMSNHSFPLQLVHQQVQDRPFSDASTEPAEPCCRETPASVQGLDSLAHTGPGMISVTEAVPFDGEQRCNKEKGPWAAP